MYRILPISDRGQITIPKRIREEILEDSENDWEKHGGLTIAEMKKKYKLSK